METAGLFLAGFAGLYVGAEWLVRGSSSLALRLGVTPLLVGLTVVAYGTSTPELIVSLRAASLGQGGLAVGNAVGSNIFNVGVILGLTALVAPLRVEMQILKFDAPVMTGVALLFLLFFRDGRIDRWEALVFLAVIVVYSALNARLARRKALPSVGREFDDGVPGPTGAAWTDAALIAGGLAVLVLGSRLFVAAAVDLARLLHVSEAVIGLTIIAAGTSLPELAASVVAAARKQPDIALANVIGSSIYNILAILGVSGAVAAPLLGQGVTTVDTLVMIGLFVVLVVIAWTGFKLKRWEGALLLACYGLYLWQRWPAG